MLDGTWETTCVGVKEGNIERVGGLDGDPEGFSEGVNVGSRDGGFEGTPVGSRDGLREGTKVGDTDGIIEAVGWADGELDGT